MTDSIHSFIGRQRQPQNLFILLLSLAPLLLSLSKQLLVDAGLAQDNEGLELLLLIGDGPGLLTAHRGWDGHDAGGLQLGGYLDLISLVTQEVLLVSCLTSKQHRKNHAGPRHYNPISLQHLCSVYKANLPRCRQEGDYFQKPLKSASAMKNVFLPVHCLFTSSSNMPVMVLKSLFYYQKGTSLSPLTPRGSCRRGPIQLLFLATTLFFLHCPLVICQVVKMSPFYPRTVCSFIYTTIVYKSKCLNILFRLFHYCWGFGSFASTLSQPRAQYPFSPKI